MPEHTSFLSYLIAMFPALGENMHNFGNTFLGHKPVDAHGAEPLVASALVVLVLIALAFTVKSKLTDYEKSVIPDDKLTLRTFFEIFIGYFYGMMKDMMGPTRAKKFFPVVGTAACFILFSNVLGMIPGFLPPTASWNITAGCSLVTLGAFTYYGLKEQGFASIAHLAGPWMGWPMIPINILIFAIEFLSTFIIRPDHVEHPLDAQHRGRPPPALDHARDLRGVRAAPDHDPRHPRRRGAGPRLLSADLDLHRARHRGSRGPWRRARSRARRRRRRSQGARLKFSESRTTPLLQPKSFSKESVTMSTRKLAPAALAFVAAFLVPLAAFAQVANEKGAGINDVKMWAGAGAGFAVGLGVLGGAMGQGKAAAAALEGISRNPGAAARIQTPMILGLALIESLVLLSFVIAYFLSSFATK